MRTLRMAVVGTGALGRHHARILAQMPGHDALGEIAWQAVSLGATRSPVLPQPTPVGAVVTQTIDTGLRFPEGVVVGEGGVWVATRFGDREGGS